MTRDPLSPQLPSGWVETVGGPILGDRPAVHVCHPAVEDRPRPGLIIIPGGGWRRDNTVNGLWLARQAAGRGYTAATLTYRLTAESPWPAAVDDVAAGLDWIQDRCPEFGIDPAQLVLVGISAGGQLAASLAYRADPGIAALVLLAAVTDLADLRLAPGLQQSVGSYLAGADPTAASPIDLVTADAPPTLVMAGGADRVVPPAVPAAFVARLDALAVRHEYIVLPDARHSFHLDVPTVVFGAIEAFLDRTLSRPGAAHGQP